MLVAGVPVVRNTMRPECTSHTRIADADEKLYPRHWPAPISLPSGLQLIPHRGAPTRIVRTTLRGPRLQIRTRPIPSAVASSVPSGLKPTPRNPPPESASGSAKRRFPVWASQTIAVPLSPPVAIRVPFGL